VPRSSRQPPEAQISRRVAFRYGAAPAPKLRGRHPARDLGSRWRQLQPRYRTSEVPAGLHARWLNARMHCDLEAPSAHLAERRVHHRVLCIRMCRASPICQVLRASGDTPRMRDLPDRDQDDHDRVAHQAYCFALRRRLSGCSTRYIADTMASPPMTMRTVTLSPPKATAKAAAQTGSMAMITAARGGSMRA
jgi:hypothetical protein